MAFPVSFTSFFNIKSVPLSHQSFNLEEEGVYLTNSEEHVTIQSCIGYNRVLFLLDAK